MDLVQIIDKFAVTEKEELYIFQVPTTMNDKVWSKDFSVRGGETAA